MSKRPSLKALDRRPAPPPLEVKSIDPVAPAAAIPARKQPSRAGKKVVTVYLPESVWRELKIFAARTDNTIDGLMRRGLDHVFAEHRANRGAADV